MVIVMQNFKSVAALFCAQKEQINVRLHLVFKLWYFDKILVGAFAVLKLDCVLCEGSVFQNSMAYLIRGICIFGWLNGV